jgi:SNF2 family DNA or RNA helicase
MDIFDNKYLIVKTRSPERITETIEGSAVLGENEGVHAVAVNWTLEDAQRLKRLKFKNVPSPIIRDYKWPGVYPPMDHQRQTASFLTITKRSFCFNEQGTGKTAAAIWASDYLLSQGKINRVLIVCPLSIMQSAWQADLFKFATHRKVGVAHGIREKRKQVIHGNYEYVVINYDGIEIICNDIKEGKFDLIIIDEANAYKNVGTKRWKAMKSLIGENTWLWMMTGTPAAQSPLDAYGLAKLCVPENTPRHFGQYRDSVMQQLTRFKWIPKPSSSTIVHNMLQPAIRYTKEECLDLPDIVHVERQAPLSTQQLKYYKYIKEQFAMTAGGEEVSAVNAASQLTKLLQISCGAVYSDSGAVVEFDVSNRLKVIEEVINEASHKVLVFVPFKHAINLLHDYLKSVGINCDVISGDVSVTRRTDIFRRFQEDQDPQVLIIQPQSAAHGVTLTAANVVIWYSPVTSIETYLQANARINRKGQKNSMTVVHIEGSSVERKLYAMLSQKLDVHTKLIDLYNSEINT